MPAVVKVPQIEGVEYLKVAKVHVQIGEKIKKGQLLLELETEKTTIPIYWE